MKVVSFYGINDWSSLSRTRPGGMSTNEQRYPGENGTQASSHCETASPLEQLDDEDPLFFLLHTDDTIIPINQSARLTHEGSPP